MINFDSTWNSFYSTKINSTGFVSGFLTRASGDARKITNIINYFKNNGIIYQTLVIPEQLHTVNIADIDFIPNQEFLKVAETDGVITKSAKAALTVRTADCLPIIYCDKVNKLIGISHNGWRGTLKRMVQKMISCLIKKGADTRTLYVAIGPGIGSCCYDADDDRYYSFLEEFEDYADRIFIIRRGRRYINLTYLNYLQLIESGISPENIDYFPFCTSCDKTRFFSFRRDDKKTFGEMLSFIIRNN